MSKGISVIVAAMSLCSCQGNGGGSKANADLPGLNVRFSEFAGEEAVTFSRTYKNALEQNFTVSKIAYILTDIVLIPSTGEEDEALTVTSAHFRDLEESNTAIVNVGETTSAFEQVRFTFGVANEVALPNDAEFANMAWPENLGGGYHYMQLEGNLPDISELVAAQSGHDDHSSHQMDDSAKGKSFMVHTGPTNGGDRSFSVTLDVIVPEAATGDLIIRMDILEWMSDPHTYDLTAYPMVMSSEEAQDKLRENGTSVFSAEYTED